MRYKLLEGEKINLEDSLAIKLGNEIQFENEVTGVVVFNSKHQILPKISSWLSEKLRGGLTPHGTIITFAKNFSYLFDYLDDHRTLKHQQLDDALLDIQRHTLKEYFNYLRTKKDGEYYFSYYDFLNEETHEAFYLLKNLSFDNYKRLIPEQDQIDYFMVIKDGYEINLNDFITRLKKIDCILTAFQFNVEDLKSKANLLF